MNALQHRNSKAFTLIELLIVIAIIGILMALLFPALNGVMEAARKAKAKNDVVQLAIAVKAYQTEYGKSPVSLFGGDEAVVGWYQGPGTGSQYNSEIVKVLTGEDYKGLNPRRIVFFEGRNAKGDAKPKDGIAPDGMIYDPWGTPYGIKVDTDYDNWVEYYGKSSEKNIRTTAIAISFGPNTIQQDISKTDDKGKKVDDIVSFQ